MAPSPQAPLREPQLAAAGRLTALTYGSGSDIFVAISNDGGVTFERPVLAAHASVVPLTRHRGPRVAIAGNTIVVTAVAGNTEAKGEHAHGLPSDGDLLAWRSADRGKTWSKPSRVNDVPAAPREGLHTLASDGKGTLFAAWLDSREEGTRLYGAWSSDAGATWSKNVRIYESPDGTICQCCHPTAVFNDTGGVEVMWRNVMSGSRDFYLIGAGADRRFTAARKLGEGTWKIDACPMDGGGMVREKGKTLTAWRREGQIFLDEPGKPESQIGEGKDVTLAADGEGVYAAWVREGQLILWHDGKQQEVAKDAAFPNLTALPDGGALLAWEANNGISLKRLPR
ncbi:MAG: exo-alpha-sialidase [Acidobacteriota bacterium]|nr:exo-alpha-sialidase [Acidobacteriota bacterium]